MNIRTSFRIPAAAALLAAAAALACAPDARPPAEPPLATVSVDRAETAAVPGGTVTLAWRFRLAEGWHLYADALNDSGLPPAVRLDLPQGWTAEPPQWPGAERHAAPGGILDHVYHDELVLLQRLVAPAGAAAPDEVEIAAAVTWLACREACVPGDTTLAVRIPVRAESGPGPEAAEIARLSAALPREPAAGEVEVSAAFGAVTLRVPGAARLEFHPAPDCVAPVDLIADGARDGDALRLRHRPPADGARLRGLLRITSDAGIVSYLKLNVPVEGERS